jgi:Domain of unknown function DUF11
MNSIHSFPFKKIFGTLFFSLLLTPITDDAVLGAVKTATTTGNWATGSTWGGTAPATTDTCVIPGGITVTLAASATCGAVTINGTLNNNAGFTLTVSGGGTSPVTYGTVGGTGTLTTGTTSGTAGTMTLSAGNWSFSGAFTGSRLTVNMTSTANDQTVSGALSCRVFTVAKSATTLHLTITPTISTTTTLTSGNIDYNSGGSQNILGANHPGNLSLSVSGTSATTTAATTISGNLSVADGATFTIGAFNLTVTGTTTIGTGTSGTLTFSSTTGTKTFTGLVTINAGATWNNSINSTAVFRGGITSSGTFTAGTGVQTFNTNSQALNGTFTIPNLTVTGAAVALTNNNTLNVTTALAGTGGLTQASNAILNLGGTATITTLTATASGDTVYYNSTTAGQTVKATTYNILAISNGSQTAILGGTTTVSGNLVVLSGTLNTNAKSVTISGTLDIFGTFGITSGTGGTTTIADLHIENGGTFNNNTINDAVAITGNITNDGTINSGTGVYTLSGTSKNIGGANAVPISSVTITGSYTNNGTFTVATALSGAGSLTNGTNDTLNIGGTSAITTLTATAAGNTVNFTGAAQTVHTSNYYNLSLSGSGTKTLQTGTTTVSGNLNLSGTVSTTIVVGLTIGGNLLVGDGSTFTAAGFALTVTGTTTVGGGTSGLLTISSATGAKQFGGLVTINAGGTWNNSSNSQITFLGGITNNGTFTAGTGVQTFSTNNQALSGTISIPNLTVTGITLTNNNSLTVATALAGTGGLTQAVNASLELDGSSAITTLTATNTGNTVNFAGAGQTVNNNNYYNLLLSGSGTVTLQTGTTTISGTLTLSGTVSVTTVIGLGIGGNLIIGDGTSFTTPGLALTVTGTTTVGGGTSGSFTISSSSGTIQLTGLVTINAGGVWNNSGNSPVTFQGGITNNGTFTAGTGIQTFNTNSQALSGTFSIPSVTVTGITLTNNGNLTVTTALAGTGGLTNASSDTLNINFAGAVGITTMTATAAGNVVNYNYAGAQTVHNNNYYYLFLSGSGAKTLQTGTTTISGDLNLSGTVTTATVVGLTVGGNVIVGDGTTFTAAGFALTVTGTTTVGGGTSGTLTISSATGTKTFIGLVTVNSGGTWNNSSNSAITFRGGITNNGTFTAGTGIQTFNTNSQALTGTFSIPSVTVTGITLTNNNTLTVTTALAGTGGLTNPATGTLNINFTGAMGITTLTASATGNTVNYGFAGTQTVKGTTYSNLILSTSGSKTTTGVTVNDTLFLKGTAAASTTSPTYGANAVLEYNGSGAQTTTNIEFPATMAGEVLINNSNGVTLNAAKTINDSLVILAGSLADNGNQITGNATYGIRLASGTTLTLGSAATGTNFPTNYTSVSLDPSSTVNYSSNTAQTVAAKNYGILIINGTRTTNNVTLANSGTIGIATSFTTSATFTSGTYVITGSTIDYNGTGAETVTAFNYNNLTISGARTTNSVTLSSSGTIGVAGTFSPTATFSSGGYVITGSTVNYNAAVAQAVTAFNYNNLTISGARTTSNVTFPSGGTIGIAGTFNPTATFSSGGYVLTGNTVDYNSSSTQSVVAFTYNNLSFDNGGSNAKTIAGTLVVNGTFTINGGATVNGGSSGDTLYGDWINNGTFTASTSTIILGSSTASAITGATTFNALAVNKSASSTTVTLNNNIQVATLTMSQGTMQTGANAVTITTTRTGNGIIIGTVTHTHAFSLGTAYSFEGPNSLITFTTGTVPTSVTMTVTQSAPSNPTMVVVNRSVSISTTGGSFTAILRLHYLDTESNGLDETGLTLWEYSGSSWVNMGSTANDTVNDYVQLAGLTSLTYPWAIGVSSSSKGVVDLNGGSAHAGDTLVYSITIKNPYLISKSGIVVNDSLASDFILNSGTISNGGSISGQTLSGSNLVGGTITWPSFSLAGGSSTTRTFQLRSDSSIDVSQTITNTAQINYGSNSEYVSVPITIINLANIVLTNSVDDTIPVPGDTLTFTVTFKNTGTSNATSVVMTNDSPNNATFLANAYGSGKGVQLDGVAKTNASDGDEVTVSGSTILVSISSMPAGTVHIVKFKAIVN